MDFGAKGEEGISINGKLCIQIGFIQGTSSSSTNYVPHGRTYNTAHSRGWQGAVSMFVCTYLGSFIIFNFFWLIFTQRTLG